MFMQLSPTDVRGEGEDPKSIALNFEDWHNNIE